MEDSQNNTNTNLYPERRAKMANHSPPNQPINHAKTATSPSSAPSKSNDKPNPPQNGDNDTTTNTKHTPTRQTILHFTSHGVLTTKQPLRNPTSRTSSTRLDLAATAAETISLLPGLLATRPDVGKEGHLIKLPPPLNPAHGPKLPPTPIRVIDGDTIDVAQQLLSLTPTINTTTTTDPPILILNMANATHAGGGFKHGALAQEECLCYRSSLSFTLKIRHYPLAERSAIYSPKVIVIRESIADGNNLLDLTTPSQLPVFAVVSAAAVCLPEVKKIATPGHLTGVLGGKQQYTYAKGYDRELMKEKMRVVLRIAAMNGHRRVVLGAFGCGAFRNPAWEVAEMWKGVFAEKEFGGVGWWEEVVFAVLGAGTENFDVFERVLGGVRV